MPTRRQIDLDRVVQVAVALADEHGFETVTLASVAQQLGIRIPSLYNYISSLQDLRDKMTLWAVRQLGERLRRAAVGRAGDDAIFSIAAAYRAFAQAHPGVYAITLRAAKPDQPELVAAAQEILDVLIAVLHPFGFSQDEALHAIRGLRSVLHGFVDLERTGGFGMNLDRDESFQRLLQMFVNGMHSDSSSAYNT